jgi:hypothetical protein
MKTHLLISLLILSQIAYAQKEIKPGDDASQYNLKIITIEKTIKETPVADLKDSVIILQWWDRNCHESKENLKSLNAYFEKYGNKILFYAISNDPLSSIEKFKTKNNYQFNFCQDAAQLENKFFPHTAKGHTVIINGKGICLYHGSFDLNTTVLDTLILTDNLPIIFQENSNEDYNLKQFANEFEEYNKTMDSYSQTGFKLKPYTSLLKKSTWRRSEGKFFYGYNEPIYNIYREGLLLNDSRIIISDSLKKELSKTDTTDLYLVGFNLRKKSQRSNAHYRKVFKSYLDSAFGLSTNLITKKVEIILITKINESSNITTTDYIWEKKISGDTMVLHNYNAQEILWPLNEDSPILFFSKVTNPKRYNMKLVLNKNSESKEQIVQQLEEQGVTSKLLRKKIQFLEFSPEKEVGPVSYTHTKQKKNFVKLGYKVGIGKGYYHYEDGSYQGEKNVAFNAGFFTQIRLTNYLSIQPGINYLTSGCKGSYAKIRVHSISTPFNILLTTSQQKPLGLYAKTGGYYSYNFAGNIKGQSLSFASDIEKNKYGWTWGLGFWLGNNGSIELSYNTGLSTILKSSTIGVANEKIWMISKVYYF